jgi:hypothetical protein
VDLGIAEILRFNALAEESRAKYLERVQDKVGASGRAAAGHNV